VEAPPQTGVDSAGSSGLVERPDARRPRSPDDSDHAHVPASSDESPIQLFQRHTELLEEIAHALSEKDSGPTAAAEFVQATREIRDLIGSVVDSDIVQGLLATRGRQTLPGLLLGVLPTHVAVAYQPATPGLVP
jgi:hypothetical protein